MPDSSAHIVKSAQRVLEVIEFFGEDRPSASVTEISRALSYPQSSTSVLLRCLRQLGYLYYDRYHRTYRLTTRAALLGCWAERGNYRGGRVPEMLDVIAARTAETVVLSVANVDYALHHLHVRQGTLPHAVRVVAGSIEPILSNVQGELQLSSYPDKQVRLALHRINAEEPVPENRVNIPETVARFQEMRERGWAIGRHASSCAGISAVAVLVPRHKGSDRVVISVVAPDAVIEMNGPEILQVLLEERDRFFAAEACDDRAPAVQLACSMGEQVNGGSLLQAAIGGR
jgi:IclR family transcriptional regulator, KDG regulon repressor